MVMLLLEWWLSIQSSSGKRVTIDGVPSMLSGSPCYNTFPLIKQPPNGWIKESSSHLTPLVFGFGGNYELRQLTHELLCELTVIKYSVWLCPQVLAVPFLPLDLIKNPSQYYRYGYFKGPAFPFALCSFHVEFSCLLIAHLESSFSKAIDANKYASFPLNF